MQTASSRIVIASVLLLSLHAVAHAHEEGAAKVSAALMSDRELLREKINLDYPGLEKVKQAVEKDDLAGAKEALANYYRQRTGKYLRIQDVQRAKEPADMDHDAEALVKRTGAFDAKLWKGDVFDWNRAEIGSKERMYFFTGLARAYAETGNEAIAKAWVNLLRSFVSECPADKGEPFWDSMTQGIRMRGGWPEAFLCFVKSPAFTTDDIVLFLKSTYHHTNSIRHDHADTSNWLTFSMAGLYTSGLVYPEFKDATDWRQYACNMAVKDMGVGWLPDGMTIELTPNYGQYFSNYFHLYEVAEYAGRLDEFDLREFVARTGPVYESYLKIMAPDRNAPPTNDNVPVSVPGIMQEALKYFPDRADFRWAATDGKEGKAPEYTSVLLPYAGFGAMRSGWGREDNMLYFDMGPVGYTHAHQDKLQVVIWAYGRHILFDPGRDNYSGDAHSHYSMDTHSHNTVLVDNRPQRRRWHTDPSPKKMPYKPLPDLKWESTDQYDYAAGVYDEAYGLPGNTESYPYEGKQFNQGWGTPATHHRRVFFLKPDIFVVADTLISKDGKPHQYDVRWHLDSTKTGIAGDGFTVATADAGQPNLEIVPLMTEGLTIKTTSAQNSPEILGWRIPDKSYPATTLQHFKTGPGTVQFLTVLLPLRSGQKALHASAKPVGEGNWNVTLADGRELVIQCPSDPASRLDVTAEQKK